MIHCGCWEASHRLYYSLCRFSSLTGFNRGTLHPIAPLLTPPFGVEAQLPLKACTLMSGSFKHPFFLRRRNPTCFSLILNTLFFLLHLPLFHCFSSLLLSSHRALFFWHLTQPKSTSHPLLCLVHSCHTWLWIVLHWPNQNIVWGAISSMQCGL